MVIEWLLVCFQTSKPLNFHNKPPYVTRIIKEILQTIIRHQIIVLHAHSPFALNIHARLKRADVARFHRLVAAVFKRRLQVGRRTNEDIGYCGFHNEGDRIYIGKLYLLKEYRGKGFGRRMFDIIDGYARSVGVETEYLRVNKGNPSVDIYKKVGFIIKESDVKDIGNGFVMDDYIMERSLR